MSETRLEEMRDQCEAFHRDHPKVWLLFRRFTGELIKRGFKHGSARAVWEHIRWETAEADTTEAEFKLNNNHHPFYARAFMNAYPKHDGFFRTRVQISAEGDATKLSPLGPGDSE